MRDIIKGLDEVKSLEESNWIDLMELVSHECSKCDKPAFLSSEVKQHLVYPS